jgi:putative DNA primase/helicase
MINDVFRALGARRIGKGWLARCPAHDDRQPSLSVGVGANNHLLVHCFAGCTFEAIRAALGGELPEPVTTYHGANEAEESAARTEAARRIWSESGPAKGTLVESYLQSRALTLAAPPALRFHPGLKHPTGSYLPAMVAAVTGKTGMLVAIQRTFLRSDGAGKAAPEPNKMSLGHCAGGAVRLAAIGQVLCLAEGVESGLSVQQATGLPVWATLGTSGLMRVELPDEARDVLICADADATGERAALAAAQRFIGEGRRVRIARPPSPHGDFNEVLQAGLRWKPETLQSKPL